MKNVGIDVERLLCDIASVENTKSDSSYSFCPKPTKEDNDICVPIAVNSDDSSELNQAIHEAVNLCLLNGASADFVDRLLHLLLTYSDIFRICLGRDPPALVTP